MDWQMLAPLGPDERAAVLAAARRRSFDPGSGLTGAVIPLTQEHLADLVGCTRPSVNQVLQRLRSQGIIGLGPGQVIVLDRSTLIGKGGAR